MSQVNIVSSFFSLSIHLQPDLLQIQRHGARYPTSGVAQAIAKALPKLQAATSFDDPKLDFVKNYTYDLGMNDLVKHGAKEYVIGFEISLLNFHLSLSLSVRSYALGKETFRRYQNLLSESGDVPFVRASGSKRVVLSARNWTLGKSPFSRTASSIWIISSVGFSAASKGTYPASVNLIIPETVGRNFVLRVSNKRLRSSAASLAR